VFARAALAGRWIILAYRVLCHAVAESFPTFSQKAHTFQGLPGLLAALAAIGCGSAGTVVGGFVVRAFFLLVCGLGGQARRLKAGRGGLLSRREKNISLYTRVQRVKGLDVFRENLRGIILGRADSQGFEIDAFLRGLRGLIIRFTAKARRTRRRKGEEGDCGSERGSFRASRK
jgi:hypothetical protein